MYFIILAVVYSLLCKVIQAEADPNLKATRTPLLNKNLSKGLESNKDNGLKVKLCPILTY